MQNVHHPMEFHTRDHHDPTAWFFLDRTPTWSMLRLSFEMNIMDADDVEQSLLSERPKNVVITRNFKRVFVIVNSVVTSAFRLGALFPTIFQLECSCRYKIAEQRRGQHFSTVIGSGHQWHHLGVSNRMSKVRQNYR